MSVTSAAPFGQRSGQAADIQGQELVPILGVLSIPDTPLDDLQPLASMKSLRVLDVSYTGHSDLSALSELELMWLFAASGNGVRDISVVQSWPLLRDFVIRDNDISQLDALVAPGSSPDLPLVVGGNPIDCDAEEGNITLLEQRGTEVDTDCR
jgi:hypothetical protein